MQVDTSLREPIRTIFESEAYLTDIELEPRTGMVWLADRSFAASGIRIFAAEDGGGIENSPVNTGLPPVEIVFIRSSEQP